MSKDAVIITAAEAAAVDLSTAAEAINATIDGITSHEVAFEEATLEPRLLIGLEILRAQEVFGMTNAQAGALGGEAKASVSRRDTPAAITANFLGFSNWLARAIPRLKRPTALKYATAFKALDLDPAAATPAQIRDRVKKLRHEAGKKNLPMPTLGSLYRAGKPEPLKLTSKPEPATADAREFWHLWQEQGEKLVHQGFLEDLDRPGLEKLKDFNLWLRDRLNARLKEV